MKYYDLFDEYCCAIVREMFSPVDPFLMSRMMGEVQCAYFLLRRCVRSPGSAMRDVAIAWVGFDRAHERVLGILAWRWNELRAYQEVLGNGDMNREMNSMVMERWGERGLKRVKRLKQKVERGSLCRNRAAGWFARVWRAVRRLLGLDRSDGDV